MSSQKDKFTTLLHAAVRDVAKNDLAAKRARAAFTRDVTDADAMVEWSDALLRKEAAEKAVEILKRKIQSLKNTSKKPQTQKPKRSTSRKPKSKKRTK